MSGAPTAVVTLTAILGEKRNGTYLHPVLLGYTAPYILEGIAFGDNAEEVKASMPATGDEWMAVFDESWEAGAVEGHAVPH